MATSSAIHTLIELATQETDEAAKRLGQAVRAAEEARQKLSLLQQYRDDYAARFQASVAAGLSATGFRNFQVFIDKLDSAIVSQQQAVHEAERGIAQERGAWQASERKRMSYDTLATRAQKAAQKQENRRDQKQSDEHAARLTLYKR
ncbi:MAG TPA: flagellar export protein FliJ [Burkholderiaceae bacterium]|nr:flagellar export protein FliJ [Burkholderiaceae bacterium]